MWEEKKEPMERNASTNATRRRATTVMTVEPAKSKWMKAKLVKANQATRKAEEERKRR